MPNDPAAMSSKDGWCWACLNGMMELLSGRSSPLAPLVKESIWSRKTSQGLVDIHTLLLCPDPSRHLWKTYETVEMLGTGGFSSVFRVRHLPTNEERAVKVIRKPSEPGEVKRILMEVALLIELDHPNIMKFHEYFEESAVVCVVTELCTGGNIGELNMQDNTLEEIRLLFRDVVSAVAYMHDAGVAHRDLKFENCLLTMADTKHRAYAKIIDFGLSSVREVGQAETWMKEAVGTVCFVAPEVITGFDTYGLGCDLWSIGVMLYIVLTDEHPFADKTPPTSNWLINAVQNWPLRTQPLARACAKPAACDLLVKLLEKDPQRRLGASGALQHIFFWDSKSCADFESSSPSVSGRTPKVSTTGIQNLLGRLFSFAHFTRFEQAVLTFVAHEAQAREVDDLRAAFVALDKARAGYLSRIDFCAAVKARGIELREDELEMALQALDPNGDDKIEYTDWLAATMPPAAITKETAMRELFNFFDIHGRGAGKVSQADLCEVLGKEMAEDVLRIVQPAEKGKVSWGEFKALLAKTCRKLQSQKGEFPRPRFGG